MANRKYYVLCADNCRFESMTKEQIINAIAEATGNTPTSIDDAFITKIKETNKGAELKFWVGTQAEYNELVVNEAVDPNVFYIFTDGDETNEIQRIATEAATQVATEAATQAVRNYIENKYKLLYSPDPYSVDGSGTLLKDSAGDLSNYKIVKVICNDGSVALCNVDALETGGFEIYGTGTNKTSAKTTSGYVCFTQIHFALIDEERSSLANPDVKWLVGVISNSNCAECGHNGSKWVTRDECTVVEIYGIY